MILVQSLLQQLNGSRIFFVVIFCVLLNSCGIFGGASNSPKTVTNNTKKSPSSKVDTIVWTKIPEDKNPPITTEKIDEIEDEKSFEFKDSYRVAAFIPFEINRMNLAVEDPNEIRNIKYLHYYAGLKMAMEDLENEGVNLTLDVYDSKESKSHIKQILKDQLPSDTDVIMGPIQKESLIELADFGQTNKIPIISPWYSSQSVADKNDLYIQLNPFLTQHYTAITEHALKHFDAEQIFLVGRENTKDVKRFKYFQEAAYNITEEENSLQQFVFDLDSLSSEYEIVKNMLLEDKPTVFILPSYSNRDAQFIYDMLRRINVEKMDKEVYVYGMPVLYNMDKISYEYFTNLNIRIVMSRFINLSEQESRAFFLRYFNEYNDFALDEAFEGYDNMMFLGRMLKKYGTGFIDNLNKDENEYFSTKFNIKPVLDGDPEEEVVDYFENRNLRIIQFINNDFTVVD